LAIVLPGHIMHLIINGSISNTGYGIATKYITTELDKLGVEITLIPKGPLGVNRPEELTCFQPMVDRITSCNLNAPFLKIWHQHDLLEHVGKGPYIGWPIFELDEFNAVEKIHLTAPDELIVCSKWAQTVVNKDTQRFASTFPLGVDTTIFCPALQENKAGEYVFFNTGKWEKRKGHDIIGRCFDKAFTMKDKVKLRMANYNVFIGQDGNFKWINQYRQLKLASKIEFIGPLSSHRDIAAFIQEADCGVFPARAEGWNMELLESMACGKPVITTNYSAHTEYCTKENAYLIEPQNGLEIAQDGAFFKSGVGSWMTLDYEEEEQLIEHMRYCYKNRPANTAGVETAEQLTWGKIASKLLLYLQNLSV
jgi:hypothetical protein